MSNSNVFVDLVVVVDVQLVDVQRRRIEDTFQFEVDVESAFITPWASAILHVVCANWFFVS